jgi:translocation and assembly module TamB
MPVALGTLPVEGDVALHGTLRGTPRAPRLALTAEGSDLIPRGAATCVRRVGLEAKVGYDGEKADVHLTASHAGSEVLDAGATVRVSAAQALAGAPLAWTASGDVDLARFPLDTVAAFVGKPIAGDLSGRVALRELHRDASLAADLDLRDLSLDRTDFPRGKVHVVLRDGTLDATARLDQADGHAETRARGAVTWGAALAPALDLGRPIDVALRAQNFRANAAMPFVQGAVSALDGRIDTDAKIHVAPGAEDGTMSGAIVLRDGVFDSPQIGQQFHGVRGSVIMKPWGTIRFDDFAAQAPTGRLLGSAQAVLRGLQLDHASASVRIPSGESIPITVEGVPFGRASGRVDAQAKMSPDGKRLDVLVDVPTLSVDLPPTTAHAVQPLDPDPAVRIGLRDGDDFIAIPLGPPKAPRKASDLAIHAVVQLGEVQLKRDTTVDIVAEGEPIIDVGEETRVRGQIRLSRGQIELQGKQFNIDRGVVSFVGDKPSDPLILATATWEAPDKTRVIADFSGHVSSGKLTLRSEPALTESQILALILFGSPDASFGTPPPGQQESTGVRVASMAGGILTQGINKAISGITSADITTRIDTSNASNPRPELDVQLSKSVSASLGYKLGVPGPGENPDRTELTLDWRIIRNWSLSATVGDQGSTALDMVWRLRY